MRWTVPLVVVLAVLGAAVAGGSVVSNAAQAPAVEPGEQFAGAIGAQHAEVSNTVETAALDRRLANAGTPTERAAVLANETDRVEARLDALEIRRERLEEDDAGRLATLVATARGLDDRLDRLDSERTALSSSLRERYDITDERFAALQNRAAAIHDAEAESLARSVAGDDVGDDLDTEEDGDGGDGDEDDGGDGGDETDDGTEDGEETTESDSEDGTTEESDDSDGSDGDSSDGDGETTEADTSDGDSSDSDGETTEEDTSDGSDGSGDGDTDGSGGDSTTTTTEESDDSDGSDGGSDGGDGGSDGGDSEDG